MKRFYYAIILFILPIIVFMGMAELYVRSLPNIYKYKNDWMEQHAEEVETLILGSSHTMFGVNPKYLGRSSFNIDKSVWLRNPWVYYFILVSLPLCQQNARPGGMFPFIPNDLKHRLMEMVLG